MTNDIPPPELSSLLYPAVGKLVINWSIAESVIEKWVVIVYQTAGGKKIEPEIPQSFSRKISFLRKSLVKIPALAAFASEGSYLIERASIIAELRNTIIHGTLSKFDPVDGRILFVKLELDKNTLIHVIEEKRHTLQEISAASANCTKLVRDLLWFTERLMKAFLR